jgi:sugar lactone lactonase YvrE
VNPTLEQRIAMELKELRGSRVGWRQGVVTDDDPLTVRLGGSGTEVLVQGIDGLVYNVSDVVTVLVQGSDMLAVGKAAASPSGGASYSAGDGLDLAANSFSVDLAAGGGLKIVSTELAADFGTGAGKVTEGNDARLSDQRTPSDNSVTSAKIVDGAIVNADVNASAAIALSKLAAGSSAQVIVADGSGVPTYRAMSGDVTIGNTGVAAIGTGVIVNADVNASAAIAYSKLNLASSITSADIVNGTIVDADVSAGAGLSQSKISGLTSDLAAKAPLASPALTGNPTAPTPSPGDADTSIATTGFVDLEVGLAAAGFTVKPQADYATVQALDSYVGTGTGTLEASANGTLLSALGLEAERWDYNLTFGWIATPYAIARDSSGNLFVTAYTAAVGYHVVKFNSSGVYQTHFGSTGSGNGQFGGACYGIAIDSSNNIYVADRSNRRIQKFNSSGTYQAQVGSAGSGNGQFGGSSPAGLCCDSSDNVFAADTANNRVQKFNSSLTYQSQFGSFGTGNGQFDRPHGIARDSSNNMFVTEHGNDRIQKFNSSGTYQSQFGSLGSGDGEFDLPTAIAIDSSNNMYVADSNNCRIQKFNSSGTYQAQFGSVGTAHGQFFGIPGVAVDGSGNLFVNDRGNSRVEKFLYTAAAAVATGQSVIVKDQNFGGPHVDHGVFEITATGGVSAKWELTRRDDLDTSAEVPSGLLVNARRRGPIIPGGMWYISTADPITLDTTPITWEQFLPGGYPTPHAASHEPGGADEPASSILGIHTLTTSFTTTGTHTTMQDEGLTIPVTYLANRRLKITLKVNPNPSGGAPNIVRYQVLRNATTVGMWQIRQENIGVISQTFVAYVDGPATGATETFKVQMLATPNNTAVQSYADGSFTRQLIIEDVGPV